MARMTGLTGDRFGVYYGYALYDTATQRMIPLSDLPGNKVQKVTVDNITDAGTAGKQLLRMTTAKQMVEWMNIKDGAQGPQGVQGPPGPTGLKGDSGSAGIQGIEGPVGPAGPQGEKGDQGEQGQRGLQGAAGAEGPVGPQGPKGDKGDQGPPGHEGPQGIQGVPGATGSEGPPGPMGASGLEFKGLFDPEESYVRGDAVVYEGSSYLSVGDSKGENPSDSSSWITLAMEGSPGAKGDSGPPGPQGERGPKGDTGEMGPSGPEGKAGPQGPAGPEGREGPRGDTGAVGPKGDPGTEGLRGPQGDPGAKGEVGPQGPQGLQGVEGPRGLKGDKGDTGATGIKGDPGAKGDTGQAGAVGATGPAGPTGPTGPAGATGPKGDTGSRGPIGQGLTPGIPAPVSLQRDVAYQAPDTTKPAFLSVMIDVNYSVTLGSTMADTVELRVGPDTSVATGGGYRVASWRSSLTGITVSIGMGAGDRGQLAGFIPPGWYYAVRRTNGTRAEIFESFVQPLV